jgi:NTP pyrophosphatase (non-canonical NTP hydrolase)
MTNNEYENSIREFAVYPDALQDGTNDALSYLALGLNGEAGEVANDVKKALRNKIKISCDPTLIKKLALELGDTLWYLTRMANELGYTLSDIQEMNIEKLLKRREEGTLKNR